MSANNSNGSQFRERSGSYAVLRSGRTLGLCGRDFMACHRSHFACSVSQICASQPVSASSRSAVSALTARRPLTILFGLLLTHYFERVLAAVMAHSRA